LPLSRRIFRAYGWSKEETMAVKPIPEGYHTISPYLMVNDADAFLKFIKDAFGAKSKMEPMRSPDGKIMHADMTIGDSHIMFGEANKEYPAETISLYLYVPDCDKVFKQALAAGAKSRVEPQDQFWGDRHGCVKDKFGNTWWISTHKQDVAEDEIKKRAKEAMAKAA
jgi:PhnB protein